MFFETGSPGAKVALITAAVGERYLNNWKQFSLPSWFRYAERNEYQILALTSALTNEDTSHFGWNKFLMFSEIENYVGDDCTLVLLDADQVISPLAPGLDEYLGIQALGVVRDSVGNPFERRLLSFLRKSHLDPRYPLDSLLLADREEMIANLRTMENLNEIYSSGFVIVPPLFRGVLHRFATESISASLLEEIDGGGDQFPFNSLVSSLPKYELDERWQGIWPFILSSNFPHLYRSRDAREGSMAVATAMLNYFCIHFSTTLPEKDFWMLDHLKAWDEIFPLVEDLSLESYLSQEISPKSYGQIRIEGSFFK